MDDSSRILIFDPWDRAFVSSAAYKVAVRERVRLSQTLRYRLGAVWERLSRKPVRADTQSLVRRLDHAEAEYL